MSIYNEACYVSTIEFVVQEYPEEDYYLTDHSGTHGPKTLKYRGNYEWRDSKGRIDKIGSIRFHNDRERYAYALCGYIGYCYTLFIEHPYSVVMNQVKALIVYHRIIKKQFIDQCLGGCRDIGEYIGKFLGKKPLTEYPTLKWREQREYDELEKQYWRRKCQKDDYEEQRRNAPFGGYLTWEP